METLRRKENSVSSVQLTTSRIGNHTRLIPSLLKMTRPLQTHSPIGWSHTFSIGRLVWQGRVTSRVGKIFGEMPGRTLVIPYQVHLWQIFKPTMAYLVPTPLSVRLHHTKYPNTSRRPLSIKTWKPCWREGVFNSQKPAFGGCNADVM